MQYNQLNTENENTSYGEFATSNVGDLARAKSPELAKLVCGFPAEIPADDDKVTRLVALLGSLEMQQIDKPIPENDFEKLVDEVPTTVTKILTYRGEWPNTTAIPNSEIPLPTKLFVSAPGIIDWREGRGSDTKRGASSADYVREYASMPGKTQPAIKGVRIYVKDDGSIFAQLWNDGAHRLCASVVRGDEFILCSSVQIIHDK